MEYAFTFLLCVLATAAAQYNTYPLWGGLTGGMMSSPMWRGQGSMMPWMNPAMTTMSGMSSMPSMGIWRSHPLFRMAAPPTTTSTASAPVSTAASTASSSMTQIGEKTPLLTVPQNIINIPKVPSSEEILTHMVLANPNPKPYVDTITDFIYSSETPKARAIMTPVYMTGMNTVMRSSGNSMDDCSPQEMARWNRDVAEWVY